MRIVIPGLMPGSTQTLQFRSKNATEVSDWSHTYRLTLANPDSKPLAPTGVSLAPDGDSFIARWNRVTQSTDGSAATDLAGYVVEFRNVVTDQKVTFETADTTFELTFNLNFAAFTPVAGQVGVRVAAKNHMQIQSDWSAEVITQNPPPGPVQNLTAEAGIETVVATWEAPANLEDDFKEYRVYLGTTPDFEPTNPVWSGVATNALISMLSAGFNYYIKVFAVDKFELVSTAVTAGPINVRSAVSVDVDAPSVPTNVSGSITGQRLTVNWTAPTVTDNDLGGYKIGYRPAGETGWSYATASHEDTSTVIEPIERFKNYEVRVQAHDFTFNYSPWSPTITVNGAVATAPSVPTGVAVKGAITSAMVVWNANPEANVTGYEVQWKLGSAPVDADPVFPTSARNMSFSEQTNESVRGYARVRAVNAQGLKSAWSAAASDSIGFLDIPEIELSDGNPPASSPTPKVVAGVDALYVSWPAVANNDLVTYEVHISTTNNFTPGPTTKFAEITGTAISIRTLANGTTALAQGTTYRVKLVAKDVDGAAAPGAQASASLRKIGIGDTTNVKTDGVAPASSPVAALRAGVGSIFAQWNAVSNADPVTYEVHLGTTTGFTPAADTKVGETASTFNTIQKLPDGSPLAYDTNYYVKLIAKDADGAAAAGAASNAASIEYVPRQVDLDNLTGRIDDTITGSVIQYAVNSSETVAPTTGWSTDTPTRTPGTFVWFRTVLTYADGSGATSNPALLTGNTGAQGSQGIKGDPGDDGQSLYTWLKFADTPTSGMADTPDGKTYMGIAYNKTSPNESENYADYAWSLIKGADGSDGKGISNTVVNYAKNTSGTSHPTSGWNTNIPATNPGEYLWTRTVTTYTDGSDSTAYSVAKHGSTGSTGAAGRGISGTSVTYQKSSSGTTEPTTWLANIPATSPGEYLWTRTVTTYTDNTTSTSFSVAKHGNTGAQGIPGEKGADGVTTYTWVKYSNSADGTNPVDSPVGMKYIGLAFNKTTQTESTNKADYQWSLIQGPKGDKGDDGIQGPKGDDGIQYYTWLKYADTPTPTAQQMYEDPAGRTYMGIAVNKTSPTESTNYLDYNWSLIKGADGSDGKGISNTVVTYAKNTSGTAEPTSGWNSSIPATNPGEYLWTRTVTTYTDGSTSTGYSVAKHGSTGSTGAAGRGITGTTVNYAVSSSGTTEPTSGWGTNIPATAPGQYLWTRTVTTYSSAPTSVTSYSVAKHGETGSQGIPGEKGADGTTTYTWVKYAPNGNPTDGQMTDTPNSNTTHIGLAYNKTTATESTSASAYTWALIQGPKGDTGDTGKGISSTAVTYQTHSSGTTAPTGTWSASPTATSPGQFLWTRTITTFTDGTTNASSPAYSVAAHGTTGATGNTGAPGRGITGTVVNYTVSNSGTTIPTTGWGTNIPATSPGQFLWTRTVTSYTDSTSTPAYAVAAHGATGAKGDKGDNAPAVSISATTQALISPATGGATSPTTSVVTAVPVGTTITSWEYSEDGGSFVTTKPAYVSTPVNNSVTVTGSSMNKRTVAIRASGGGVSDTITIAKVMDGAKGDTGNTGGTGAAGADAYTVFLTNEAQVFPGTVSTAIAAAPATTFDAVVYKGATQINASIGTITGHKTGLTTSVNNTPMAPRVTVNITTALTQGGELIIPVTADGKTFEKKFSWSVSFKGVTGDTGAKGDQGISVSSVTPFYRTVTKGASAPAQPSGTGNPSGWSTTEPAYAVNTELYRTERILYSNGTAAWTPVTKVASYDAADAARAIAITADNRVRKANVPPVVGDGANAPVGALWYEYGAATSPGTGTVLKQTYEWTGAVWQPRGIDRTFLPAVDIGTGTFGDLSGARLVANSVKALQVDTDDLTSNTAFIDKLKVNSANIIGQLTIGKVDGLNSALDAKATPADVTAAKNEALAAARDAAMSAENLVVNPSFELGFESWTAAGGPEITENTAFARTGSKYVTIAAGSSRVLISNSISVTEGEVYKLGFFFRGTSVSGTIGLRMQTSTNGSAWTDAVSGGFVNRNVSSGTTSAWTDLNSEFTVPAGVTYIRMRIAQGTSGGTAQIDDAYIKNITDAKRLEAAAAAVESRALSRGTNLVTNGTGYLGSNYNFTTFSGAGTPAFDASDAPPGTNGSFQTPAAVSGTLQNDEFIPIDPALDYQHTFWVRQQGASTASRLYGMVMPFDAFGLSIQTTQYMYIPNTLTTLTQPLNPGDTVVHLTSVANYYGQAGKPANTSTHFRRFIWWDYVDAGGKLWPAETYSRNGTNSGTWVDGAVDPVNNTIALAAPYDGPAKPAGTKVSNGSAGSTYPYTPGTANVIVPGEWTRYSATYRGGQLQQTAAGGNSPSYSGGWPPGTAMIKLAWFINYNGTGANSQIAVAGISFSDASAAALAATNAQATADSVTTLTNGWRFSNTTEIDGGAIRTQTVTANQIAANTIDTSRLLVGDITNYAENPYPYTVAAGAATGWDAFPTGVALVAGTNTTAGNGVIRMTGTASSSNKFVANSMRIPVKEGDKFSLYMKARTVSGRTTGDIGFVYHPRNPSGSGSAGIVPGQVAPAANGATIEVTGEYVVPANVATVSFGPWMVGAQNGIIEFFDFQFRRKVGTVMIENGAITGDLLAVNAVKATHIDTDAVEAKHIKAGSITIGPSSPIAPGTVATPTDVSNAQTAAINTAAGDATTKANNARDAAVSTAGTQADSKISTAISPITGKLQTWTKTGTTKIDGGEIAADTVSAGAIKTAELATNTAFINALTVDVAKITNLTFDKIQGGTGIINNVTVKSTMTLGDASNDGIIQSHGYVANTTGFRLSKNSLDINQGTISAQAIQLQIGQNLVPVQYAGFEFAADAYAHMQTSAGNAIIQTSGAKFNKQHLRVDSINSSSTTVYLGDSATDYNIPVEAGKQYIYSAYFKGTGSGVTTMAYLIVKGSNGENLSSVGRTMVQSDQNWHRISNVVTIPAGVTGVLLALNTNTASTNAQFDVDGVQFEERTSASNEPSAWNPGTNMTMIDGGMIRTGEIRSTANVTVGSTTQPAWSLNTTGGAQVGNLDVRGRIVVGATTDGTSLTTGSHIRSANYSAGSAGFILRGADGFAEFQNVVINMIGQAGAQLIAGASTSGARTVIDRNGLKVYSSGSNVIFDATGGNISMTGDIRTSSSANYGIHILNDSSRLGQGVIRFMGGESNASYAANISLLAGIDGKSFEMWGPRTAQSSSATQFRMGYTSSLGVDNSHMVLQASGIHTYASQYASLHGSGSTGTSSAPNVSIAGKYVKVHDENSGASTIEMKADNLVFNGDNIASAWTTFTLTFRAGTTAAPVSGMTRIAKYQRFGKLVFFHAQVTFGTYNPGTASGFWSMDLPVPAISGQVQLVNVSVAGSTAVGTGDYGGFGKIEGTSSGITRMFVGADQYTVRGSMFNSGSRIYVHGFYEAA